MASSASIVLCDNLSARGGVYRQGPWEAVRVAQGISAGAWPASNPAGIRAALIAAATGDVTLISAQAMLALFTSGLPNGTAQLCVDSMNGVLGLPMALSEGNTAIALLEGGSADTEVRNVVSRVAASAGLLRTAQSATLVKANGNGVPPTNCDAINDEIDASLILTLGFLTSAILALSGAASSGQVQQDANTNAATVAAADIAVTGLESLLAATPLGSNIIAMIGNSDSAAASALADLNGIRASLDGGAPGTVVETVAANTDIQMSEFKANLDSTAVKADPGYAGATAESARATLDAEIGAAVDTAITGMRAEAVARLMPGAATATLNQLWVFLQTQLVP